MFAARPGAPAHPPPSSVAQAAPDLAALREAAARCGIELYEDAYGTQARAPAAPSMQALRDGALALLPGHAILTLSGDDTRRFLHSQTTNDIEHQAPGEARWHGYCTAKGRLLATMLAWPHDGAMRLLLPDSVAPSIRKRLAMFVLRAKVRIADERGSLAVLGLSGARVPAALEALGLAAPEPLRVAYGPATESADAPEPETVRDAVDVTARARDETAGNADADAVRATVIGLPALHLGASTDAGEDAPGRWLLVVPLDVLQAAWTKLAGVLDPIGSEAWRWGQVRSGIAPIVPATSEQFVPQMLNLEAVGAVSFTKGCYPGQEVVARSHYLGKQKRRAFLGRLPDGTIEPAPGSDVLDAGGQPVGKVVVAAPAPGGGVDLLFEARLDAVDSPLQASGATLQRLELPYALPAS